MTRHRLLQGFTNSYIGFEEGELVILLDDRGTSGGYEGLLPPPPQASHHLVMIKNRHGRKVRVPRSLLSPAVVEFNCQLCDCAPMALHRDYVTHMIDCHLRTHLIKGLNMKKQAMCPFPTCAAMNWPILDNLLYHYASHHNVLEKVLMYETEKAVMELRKELRHRESTIEELVKETEELKMQAGNVNSKLEAKGTFVKHTSNVHEEITRSRQSCESSQVNYAQELEKLSLTFKTKCDELKLLSSEASSQMLEQTVVSSTEEVARYSNYCNFKNKEICRKDEFMEAKERKDSVKIEPLHDLTEDCRKPNEELLIEMENVNRQNENLKNIIEIGKSTVETAKKINHDLAGENRLMKGREKQTSIDLVGFENSLAVLAVEKEKLGVKYLQLQERLRLKTSEAAKKELEMKGKYQAMTEELQHLQSLLSTDGDARIEYSRNLNEKIKKLSGQVKSLTTMRDDARKKLCKVKENLKQMEDAKRSIEADNKVLVIENRNASNEIKTMKHHLNSSRNNIVDKAVAKDELLGMKKELSKKTSELNSSQKKIKKLSSELSSILVELRNSKDAQNKAEKSALKLQDKIDDLEAKLKLKNNEYEAQAIELEAASKSLENMGERIEFYVGQCSEFEVKDNKYQKEVELLQKAVEKSTEQQFALEKELESVREEIIFYRDQEEVLVDEIEKLKSKNLASNNLPVSWSGEEDLAEKYRQQCGLVEELLRKQEKMVAQDRRKDWEMENYRQRLDAAFEAEVSYPCLLSAESCLAPSMNEALDLRMGTCAKDKSEGGVENVKVETEDCPGVRTGGTKRKYYHSPGPSFELVSPSHITSPREISWDSTCPMPQLQEDLAPAVKVVCVEKVKEEVVM